MSDITVQPQTIDDPACVVRAARPDEAAAVAAGVRQLLAELGATPPPPKAMEAAARTLIDTPALGVVLVAEAEGELVGVLGGSWQVAIHGPGRYGLIQDLWVHTEWRSRAIGSRLLDAYFDVAAAQGIARVEVGIPRDGFPALDATRRFYLMNGFVALGARLRRVVA